MSLKRCEDCKNNYNGSLSTCPHCERDRKRRLAANPPAAPLFDATSIIENADIDPCPFCGATASVEEIPAAVGPADAVRFTVGCDSQTEADCVGYQSLTTFDTRRAAIAAWNRRA